MVSFYSFRDSKCEWNKGLRDFANQFNDTYGKDYTLSKCLDISDNTKKQPEVLLEAFGERPMVIECKKIVYPPDFYKKKKKIHIFFDFFITAFYKNLSNYLPKDFYELCINESILDQKHFQRERELGKLARKIILHIKNNLDEFLTSQIISIADPIHCCFRFRCDSVPESQLDDTYPTSYLRLTLEFSSHPLIVYEKRVEAEKVIAEALKDKPLPDTEQKFKEYTHCLKILILEICGNRLYSPEPKKILEIINHSNIPPIIDQIWLAVPDDEEKIITYHRVL